jgi:uncharacterized membrane protein
VIASFLILAVVVYIFERSQYEIISPIYGFFASRVFADSEATSELLGNIAGSIITVTSITITLLLLIVQQSASNMTTQVFDQFLRRRSNQFYFGFFVGVAVYTLVTLATVDEPFNPVFAASLVFLFTVIAMFMLMVMFYSTIHQMRPAVILSAIHSHALAARRHQRNFIQRTRRASRAEAPFTFDVRANHHGFITSIDLDTLSRLIKDEEQVREIVMTVTIGSFVAYQDRVAQIKLSALEDTDDLASRIRSAIQMERNRDITTDPTYGIHQLEIIAWASISPSRSNLTPGLQTIFNLRDLLARWIEDDSAPVEEEPLPVVYNDDVILTLIRTFESLAIVASLSKEHQVLTGILVAFSTLFERLPGPWQDEAEAVILRILPTLDSHFLTASMEQALNDLIDTLQKADRESAASRVRHALMHLQDRTERHPA